MPEFNLILTGVFAIAAGVYGWREDYQRGTWFTVWAILNFLFAKLA